MKSCSQKIKYCFRIFISCCFFIAIFNVTSCSRNPYQNVSYEKLIEYGDQHFEDGDYETALEYYYTASNIEPENYLSYYKLGILYGYLNQIDHPDNIVIRGKRNRLSKIKYSSGSNYNKALQNFEKAYELGFREARAIIRAFHENIQHQDVQY